MNRIIRNMMAIGVCATALPAMARTLEVYPLSASNTLVKVIDPEKYLLLPVQESMPDSKIDILVNGEVVKRVHVRLADSKQDYTVPLDLSAYKDKGPVLLNVISESDRTHSRNASDFSCWKNLAMSDTFDVTNREKYRPAYHHTPKYGWMNDPNGMFYKDGVWHLYYQYNPYGSKWQNMTWGHSTSTDLVNWKSEPIAIEANGLGQVFSGNCVVDKDNTAGFGKDAVIAMYTSAGASQVQSLAHSEDNGKTFKYYNGSPVIPNPSEARDPNMFWHEPTRKWVLVLAHSLEKEMQIYTSPDLKHWTLESAFGKGYGSQDGVWECPDLFELPVAGTDEKKWVLVCNINPGSPMGGSGTQYFVGDFDGKRFTCDDGPEVSKWMDYGKDHYATVSWSNAPEGRRTVIGWMSNWQYANEVPTMQFRSANTLPREMGLFKGPDGGYYVSSTPSPELDKLRGAKKRYKGGNISSKGKEFAIPELCEISVDYNVSESGTLEFTLCNAAGEEFVMSIDGKRKEFVMDRTKSGLTDFSADFASVTKAPMHRESAKGTLRVYVDKCSVEAFDSEGRFVMTDLVFPTQPYTKLKISARGGKAEAKDIKIYTLTTK